MGEVSECLLEGILMVMKREALQGAGLFLEKYGLLHIYFSV